MPTNTRRKRAPRAQTARNETLPNPPAQSSASTPRPYSPARTADPPPGRLTGALLWLVVGLAVLLVLWGALNLIAPQLLPDQLRVASPAPPPPSPEGRISFMRQGEGGRPDLYVVNPDGSGAQRADLDMIVHNATWSRDGRQLLLQGSVNGISTVVLADVGADNKIWRAVQLTADIKVDSALPTWSPDGTRIAFQSKRDGGDYQLFVMNSDGSNKQRLSDGKGYAGQATWSPDGQSIAYVQGDKGDLSTPREIFVVPASGGEAKKLTSLAKPLSRPLWSPDGSSIFYIENRGDRSSIFHIMNADGTSSRVLVQEGANKEPHFSPTGDRIVYYSVAPPAGSDIYIVPVAGGALSKLTDQSVDDYSPNWSYDGTRLVWASNRDGVYRIVTANVDGSSQKVISSGEGSDSQPAWGPPLK